MTAKELKEKKEAIFKNWTSLRQRDEDLENLMRQAHEEIKEGDGVTLNLWSDKHACTVIRRTPSTITVQRDKAILDKNFKPERDGFYCTNNSEQEYSYERDENGTTYTLRYSKKYGRFMYLDKPITIGRYEFYDYNF